jgi:hypothetical protein
MLLWNTFISHPSEGGGLAGSIPAPNSTHRPHCRHNEASNWNAHALCCQYSGFQSTMALVPARPGEGGRPMLRIQRRPLRLGQQTAPFREAASVSARTAMKVGISSVSASNWRLDLNGEKDVGDAGDTVPGKIGIVIEPNAINVTIRGGGTSGTNDIEYFDWCIRDEGGQYRPGDQPSPPLPGAQHRDRAARSRLDPDPSPVAGDGAHPIASIRAPTAEQYERSTTVRASRDRVPHERGSKRLSRGGECRWYGHRCAQMAGNSWK